MRQGLASRVIFIPVNMKSAGAAPSFRPCSDGTTVFSYNFKLRTGIKEILRCPETPCLRLEAPSGSQ
jgi:hypothetical protein